MVVSMRLIAGTSSKDIKILLFLGYAVGYPLAVLPPILIDPILKSHILYPPRSYAYAFLCLPIYLVLLIGQATALSKTSSLKSLYISICGFFGSILVSLPVFWPEVPHQNVLGVGFMTALLSTVSVFVWSIGRQITLNERMIRSSGPMTLEYIKALSSFVRQGAFACVTLFGAIFFVAWTTMIKFVDQLVTNQTEIFWLHNNIGVQMIFYTLYAVAGIARYFFVMNVQTLLHFRLVATRLDTKGNKPKPEQGAEVDMAD